MKRMSMNTRDRRALLIGVAIAVPAVLIPCVVKPYLETLSAYHQDMMDAQDRLAREQHAVANLPALPPTRLAALHQLEQEMDRLFQGGNDLSATGDLAQYVGSIAQANGVQLLQTETRQAQSVRPDLKALQLGVRAKGDLDGILHFLHQLESGGKLVRVGDVTVDVEGGVRDTNRLRGVEILSISASIYGYRLTAPQWQTTPVHEANAPAPFVPAGHSRESLDAAVNHDLFSSTRTRPALSYRFAMTQGRQTLVQKPERPRFHLIGTIVSTHGANFAMIQQDSARGLSPEMISVGQQVGDYRLSALRRDTAVFRGPDGTPFELHAGQLDVPDISLTVNRQTGVNVVIEKDSIGIFRMAATPMSNGGAISFQGPNTDSVYAQVNGPPGWQGDTGKFLLAADGKGNCCKQIPMTQPGNYSYRIWDQGTNLVGQGTITMAQQ